MNIIQKIQKLIYTSLSNNEQNIKVYSCPDRDTVFPYIIYEFEKIKKEENFTGSEYEINLIVKIFYKSETNIELIHISDELTKNIMYLQGIRLENSIIISINNENTSIELYNGLNSVWRCGVKFKFIVNETE